MKYVQFYKVDLSGNISAALGSDGVMVLDGRWGTDRIHSEAYSQAQRLNTCLNKALVGYKVWQGRSFSDSHPVTEYRKIYP